MKKYNPSACKNPSPIDLIGLSDTYPIDSAGHIVGCGTGGSVLAKQSYYDSPFSDCSDYGALCPACGRWVWSISAAQWARDSSEVAA